MTENITTFISEKLANAGFEAAAEYNEIAQTAEYCAFYRISEMEVGELRHSSTDDCCITATIRIQMLGKKCGFSDAAELAQKAESFMSNLIFTSDAAVKKLTLGQTAKNLPLGKLERTCTAVLKTYISKGR